MRFYNIGNWAVSEPVVDSEDPEELQLKMTCPHPKWEEISRDTTVDPEDETNKYLTITEACAVCKALRIRLFPEGMPEEPFNFAIPLNVSWYERLFNLGNFTILSRRFFQGSNNPPVFMTRVETPAGNVHLALLPIDTLMFSPAALERTKDMELMAKLGPKRYVDFRVLKEGLKTKPEKDLIRRYADLLVKVVQDIGPESLIAARTLLEGEIGLESAEMDEYEIQAMEREVKYRKAAMERRKRQKPK